MGEFETQAEQAIDDGVQVRGTDATRLLLKVAVVEQRRADLLSAGETEAWFRDLEAWLVQGDPLQERPARGWTLIEGQRRR